MSRGKRTLLLGVVLPALAYLAVRAVFFSPMPTAFERLGIDPASIDPDTLPPRIAADLGLMTRLATTEYVVLVISSSICPAAATDGFDDSVKTIRQLLRDQLAHRPEAVERMVGVALDRDPWVGADYLKTLGGFDEIITGGTWLNTATEKYLWGAYAVSPETPQVVLLERRTRYIDGAVLVEDEHLIRAILGASEIMKWVAEGAVLAPVEHASDRSGPRVDQRFGSHEMSRSPARSAALGLLDPMPLGLPPFLPGVQGFSAR